MIYSPELIEKINKLNDLIKELDLTGICILGIKYPEQENMVIPMMSYNLDPALQLKLMIDKTASIAELLKECCPNIYEKLLNEIMRNHQKFMNDIYSLKITLMLENESIKTAKGMH